MRKVVMVTGMQAAGKTTIGRLLAARLNSPAAAFDGDVFYRMVAVGNVNMTPDPHPEAIRQVRLRYEASALVAQHYADNGFDFVYTDIVVGSDVARWMDSIKAAERHLIVLTPSAETISEREVSRGGRNSYRDWQDGDMTLIDAVRSMQQALEDMPRRGLWLDTSEQTPSETVNAILDDGMTRSLY